MRPSRMGEVSQSLRLCRARASARTPWGRLGSVGALEWTLLGIGVALGLYLVFVLALVTVGRRSDARALAGFIPDCVVLFRRLLSDPRISGWRKAAIGALIAYLAMPIDLVPDFIPVAGQLDDAIVVALVLRTVLRSGGPELLRAHWPGPESSLAIVSRVAYGKSPRPTEAGS